MPNSLSGCIVLNLQRRFAVDLSDARAFVRRLRGALDLGQGSFNVCFVDDERMTELNARFRRKARPTDVLSFPWAVAPGGASHGIGADRRQLKSKNSRLKEPRYSREFARVLGDVVISVETARRNARTAGHSTAQEIRLLILHGLLHLLGYDHETDQGEMTAVESSLRERLCQGKR